MNPQDLIAAFFNTGQIMAGQIQPYARSLIGLLILVEVLTIAITYMMADSDNPPAALWAIVRLLFTGGFGFWWIINAWVLGLDVIGSFDQIGRNLGGAPNGLEPSQFFDIAIRITKILWNAPSSGRLLPTIGLDILEGLIIVAIMILLGLLAAVAAFSLIATMLIIGPGSIFVGFMPCRFTSSLSENYFVWLVRTGALLLGFYVVLATCQHFAALWNTTLSIICRPVTATLPVPFLGAAPTAATATACTAPIPVDSLLTLFFDILLMAVVGLCLPFILAALAGHGVHLGLENLASAKYLAGSTVRHMSNAIGGLSHQVSRMAQHLNQHTTLNQRIEAGAAAAARSAPTQPLTPPPSSPSSGGWNGRPSGPPIAPLPSGPNNSGPGGSPAGLSYQPQPGRPGPQTRAEAVDITNLQGGNRG
jgi:hypothetical protein